MDTLVFVLLFIRRYVISIFFFFNDTATTEIYTLSLHDALPISTWPSHCAGNGSGQLRKSNARSMRLWPWLIWKERRPDRKSTRLNSSHGYISYAVFCLKKKKIIDNLSILYQLVLNDNLHR